MKLDAHIGDGRSIQLRVEHVADMFDMIVGYNDEIAKACASKDLEPQEAVRYQRPVGASSRQGIGTTLRKALIRRDPPRTDQIQRRPMGGTALGEPATGAGLDPERAALDRHQPRRRQHRGLPMVGVVAAPSHVSANCTPRRGCRPDEEDRRRPGPHEGTWRKGCRGGLAGKDRSAGPEASRIRGERTPPRWMPDPPPAKPGQPGRGPNFVLVHRESIREAAPQGI